MKKNIPFAVTLLLLLSCNQQKPDTKSELEKLMQTSRDWSQIASTANVEKALSFWADDATVIMAGQPVLNGKEEIRKMVEGSFKTPGFKISWEPLSGEVSESGDMGYLIEKQTMTMNDSTGKTISLHSTGITIWKKQTDGSWKNIVDAATPEP